MGAGAGADVWLALGAVVVGPLVVECLVADSVDEPVTEDSRLSVTPCAPEDAGGLTAEADGEVKAVGATADVRVVPGFSEITVVPCPTGVLVVPGATEASGISGVTEVQVVPGITAEVWWVTELPEEALGISSDEQIVSVLTTVTVSGLMKVNDRSTWQRLSLVSGLPARGRMWSSLDRYPSISSILVLETGEKERSVRQHARFTNPRV